MNLSPSLVVSFATALLLGPGKDIWTLHTNKSSKLLYMCHGAALHAAGMAATHAAPRQRRLRAGQSWTGPSRRPRCSGEWGCR